MFVKIWFTLMILYLPINNIFAPFVKRLDGSPTTAVIFRVSTSVTSCVRCDRMAAAPITALSSPLTHIHLIIFISTRSHRAWPRPSQTAVLSFCFSFFSSHFFPPTSPVSHLRSILPPFYPIHFPVFHLVFSLWSL